MTKTKQDMSISDMLHDPLIRQVLRADGVSLSVFADLMEDAARQRAESLKMEREQIPAAFMLPKLKSGRNTSRSR